MLPQDVCVVTTDLNFVGASAGHFSHLVFIESNFFLPSQIELIAKRWREKGVQFLRVPLDRFLSLNSILVRQSFALSHFLRQYNFKKIHFDDSDGLAYFSLLAKKQGLAFTKSEIQIPYEKSELSFTKNEDALVRDFLIRQCLEISSEKKSALPSIESSILISVCLVTCDRPEFLQKALISLENQTYKKFEVILADNSSLSTMDRSRLVNFSFPIKIIEPEIKTPGAARNLAALKSEGQYLLFMDDDNLACAHELETFVVAMQKSQVDILTCASQIFTDESSLDEVQSLHYWIPLGPCLNLGLRHNVFGDTNFFIRKDSFFKIGQFRSENFYGEDWEFLARAVLKGFQLNVLPDRLFFYRRHAHNLTKQVINKDTQNLRMAPYLKLLPPETGAFVQLFSVETPADKFATPFLASNICYDHKLLTGQEVSKQLLRTQQLTTSVHGSQLVLNTEGDDPWLEIAVPEHLRGPLELNFWMSSNVEQIFQVFWKSDSNQDFQEASSVTQKIIPGNRRMTVLIDSPDRQGSVRLDFGPQKSEVVIFGLILKGFLSHQGYTAQKRAQLAEEFNSISTVVSPGFYCDGARLDLDEFELSGVEIQEASDSLRIISKMNDPQMILNNFRQFNMKRALLSYKLKCETDFQFRVFWSTGDDNEFSETRVKSLSFEKGEHSGQLYVESEQMIERLRIDPLEHQGSVQIKCLMLEGL
jgi:hypothetical protein